jgi:hypothetical protein
MHRCRAAAREVEREVASRAVRERSCGARESRHAPRAADEATARAGATSALLSAADGYRASGGSAKSALEVGRGQEYPLFWRSPHRDGRHS